MSEQAMIAFLNAVARDGALSGRLREAVADNDRRGAVEAIADLAAAAGYEVGPADVEAFRLRALASMEGELSDQSLDSVTGGSVTAEPVADPFQAITHATGGADRMDTWLMNW